jgi:hypothetical protein
VQNGNATYAQKLTSNLTTLIHPSHSITQTPKIDLRCRFLRSSFVTVRVYFAYITSYHYPAAVSPGCLGPYEKRHKDNKRSYLFIKRVRDLPLQSTSDVLALTHMDVYSYSLLGSLIDQLKILRLPSSGA